MFVFGIRVSAQEDKASPGLKNLLFMRVLCFSSSGKNLAMLQKLKIWFVASTSSCPLDRVYTYNDALEVNNRDLLHR